MRLFKPFADSDLVGLISAMRGRRLGWWAMLLFQLLLVPFSLIDILTIKVFIDYIVRERVYDLLWPAVALVLSLVLFTLSLEAWFHYKAICFSQFWDITVKKRMIERLLHKPLSFFLRVRSGDVLYRFLNDTAVVPGYLTGIRWGMVVNISLIVVMIAFMFYLNSLLALVAVSLFPLQIVSLYFIGKRIRTLREILRAKDQSLLSVAENIFNGIESIKSFHLEPVVKKDWVLAYRDRIEVERKLGIVERILGGAVVRLLNLGGLLVLGVGIAAVLNGTLTLGGLMAFLMVIGRVQGPGQQIAGYYLSMIDVKVAVKRMKATWIDSESELDSLLVPGKRFHDRLPREGYSDDWGIELENVSYQCKRNSLISDITLNVSSGELIQLKGGNGAGKTTLLRVMAGLLPCTKGDLRVLNRIGNADETHSWLRHNVIYLTHRSMWLQDTLKNNLLYALSSEKKRTCDNLDRVLQLMQCDRFVSQLPLGLATPVAANGSNFSSGELQRLCLVRALLAGPKLLILDEALSAISSTDRVPILENLKNQLGENASIVFVTHDGTLSMSDRIIEMRNGRLIKSTDVKNGGDRHGTMASVL